MTDRPGLGGPSTIGRPATRANVESGGLWRVSRIPLRAYACARTRMGSYQKPSTTLHLFTSAQVRDTAGVEA